MGEFSTASSSNLSFPHRGRSYARVFHNKIVGNPRVIRRVYPHLCTTMWITFLVFVLPHGVLKAVFRRGESILETVFGTFSVSLAQTRKIGPQNRFSRFMGFCVFPFETPLGRLRRQLPSQRGAMRNRCLESVASTYPPESA